MRFSSCGRRRDVQPDFSEFATRRRRLLGAGASLAAGLALGPALSLAQPAGQRRLKFYHLHTGERLSAVYFADQALVESECHAIDRVLRDFRTGDVAEIDRNLLDFLWRLQQSVGVDGEFQVISGYRSPKTNEDLRAAGRGVAQGSLHTRAQAIDTRLPGCPLTDLRQAALELQLGGVGFYPKSDFIHIDTGRVRFW
ncbi:MAG: DUF882 domain-containing protein [Wenzhouxiangella sp.]